MNAAPDPLSAVPPDHFDRLYEAATDPWNFATSAYEAGKYAATLAALEGRRFTAALELGCSIGVLTARLAPRCDRLVGVDLAEAALATARRRLAPHPHVRLERLRLPGAWPTGGPFDLIVASEILYFFTADGLAALAGRVRADLAPGGRVLLVHWLGPTGTPLAGDAATAAFLTHLRLPVARQTRTAAWRLDLLEQIAIGCDQPSRESARQNKELERDRPTK